MELSGNPTQRAISVANEPGRSFTGLHGNGVLDATTGISTGGWPVGGFRGGNWDNASDFATRVSGRRRAYFTNTGRSGFIGGRGVRAVP